MNYLRSAEELVNNVYLTSDLTKFKQITGNRPHNPQHVKRLTSSIKRYGVLQNPIIVNENMVVVDGQHRLWAFDPSENLDFEIPVVAYHGLDVSWQAYLFWVINIKPKKSCYTYRNVLCHQ